MTFVKFKNNTRPITPFFNNVLDGILNDAYLNDRIITKTPLVNIAESVNEFAIELAAPGMKKEDFKISLDKNVLTISTEKKEDANVEGKNYTRKEYDFGTFSRSFNLPDSVDQGNISASYVDGILSIHAAKKDEAKLQAREINIL